MSALQETGRVEQDGGLRFYEQDIVQLDYIYTEDVAVDFEVVYNKPGFGLLVSASSIWIGGKDDDGRKLLAKVGAEECSYFEKSSLGQEILKRESCTLSPDGKLHTLRFSKTGTQLRIYELSSDGQELLARCSIGEHYDRYTLGVYSSAGNIVRSMDIKDSRPSAWGTSVKNTNGGRIVFEANGFKISNAENAAEVIRENISLKAGRYFFSCEILPVGGKKKAAYYVFPSKEPKIKAKEKNLLVYDRDKYGDVPYFDIQEDMEVTVLFQVYAGEIRNIAIKEDAREGYAPTGNDAVVRAGSSLQVNLSNVSEIDWTGIVDAVPTADLDEVPPYGVFVYGNIGVSIDACHVLLGKKYSYKLKSAAALWTFEVMDEGKSIYYTSFVKNEDMAKIFMNLSGVISSIEIYDLEGKKKNVMHQRTLHKVVPGDIGSPIIVVGKDGVPFDLSASYRILPDGSYYFTNWEREVFPAKRKLELQGEALGDTDVVLYGLREEADLDRLYEIQDVADINSINSVAKKYDTISNEHYTLIRGNTLVLDDELEKNGYKMFIVDYLKNDSYAINENEGYEVMISTKDEGTFICYDMKESGEIHEYKILDFTPEDDKYIVLRRPEAK